jgi:hypothetical protein
VQRFQRFMGVSCSEIVHRKNENTWLLVWPHPLEREHLRKRKPASIITMVAGSINSAATASWRANKPGDQIDGGLDVFIHAAVTARHGRPI